MVASCRDGCKEMEISSADAGGTCVGSVGAAARTHDAPLEFGFDVEQCSPSPTAPAVRRVRRRRPTSRCRRRPSRSRRRRRRRRRRRGRDGRAEAAASPRSPSTVCRCLPRSRSPRLGGGSRRTTRGLIRELDQFRNDRVVSGAQAQGICPTGYYQAVENPNHWACGAGCAGGMYSTSTRRALPVSLGRPKPEGERRPACADSVERPAARRPSKISSKSSRTSGWNG